MLYFDDQLNGPIGKRHSLQGTWFCKMDYNICSRYTAEQSREWRRGGASGDKKATKIATLSASRNRKV